MNHLSHPTLRGKVDVAAAAAAELSDDSQRAAFSEMRAKLTASHSEALVDDITLLRFLAADSFQVDLGHARLAETLAWRAKDRVDEVLAHPPSELERYRAIRVRHWIGTDREGRPVMMERIGEFMANAPGEDRPFSRAHWIQLYAW